MSGPVLDDIELIIEDVHGDHGGKPPSRDGDDGGGDDGGTDGNAPEWSRPRAKQYSAAIALAIVSIAVFFLVPTAAFLFLRVKNLHNWSAIHLPVILWVNTCVLLASSVTLELARRRLKADDSEEFRRLWALTTLLGLLFVAGQVVAWWQLAAQGVYKTSALASGNDTFMAGSAMFFYLFTALHAAHLACGIAALLYVGWRKSAATRIAQPLAVEVASYYWHFMDGLWLFLLALLYFGQ